MFALVVQELQLLSTFAESLQGDARHFHYFIVYNIRIIIVE